MILCLGIDFFVASMYIDANMKTILSVIILAASIILAAILFVIVRDTYPEIGSFYSVLCIGLIVFGLGIAIFICGLLLERDIKESQAKN
jgi:hypothetical protein